MPQAPRAASVVLRVRRAPRSALIDVEDDGPGLPSPDAPIFDAFFSTKEGGTGLGLAITHRIVTDHGGSIDVTSLPGKTEFQSHPSLGQCRGIESMSKAPNSSRRRRSQRAQRALQAARARRLSGRYGRRRPAGVGSNCRAPARADRHRPQDAEHGRHAADGEASRAGRQHPGHRRHGLRRRIFGGAGDARRRRGLPHQADRLRRAAFARGARPRAPRLAAETENLRRQLRSAIMPAWKGSSARARRCSACTPWPARSPLPARPC